MNLELIDDDFLVRIDAEDFKVTGTQETEEGYLYVDGIASYVGVMKYLNEDGSERREYVPASTLKKYGKNLLHKPVTLEHPAVGLLDSTNVAKYQVGEVVDAKFDENTEELKVRLLVKDKTAVDEIKSRKTLGLSPGYKVKRKPARPGAAWDYEQAERLHNHCALVRNPRAGSGASVRLDSEGNVIIETETSQEDALKDKEKDENEDGFKAALDAMKSSLDAMKSKMDKMEEKMAKEGNEDGKKPAFLEKKEEKNEDSFSPAELIEAVDAARELDVAFDAATDSVADIRRKVVLSKLGEDAQVDSDDVRGAFKLLVAQAKADKQAAADAEADTSLDSIAGQFQFNAVAPNKERKTALDNKNFDTDDLPVFDPREVLNKRKEAK